MDNLLMGLACMLIIGGILYGNRLLARRERATLEPVRHMQHLVQRTPAPVAEVAAAPQSPTARTLIETLMDPSIVHLMFIGGSGGGKTTLVHALAQEWAASAQRVVVCDPDAFPGKWPGCDVRGAGDEFLEIDAALQEVGQEFDDRVAAQAEGVRDFPHWYVIIDEYWDVWPKAPGTKREVERILRRGRKLGIHLVLGSQDDQANSMGLNGQTHLMKNFTWQVVLEKTMSGRIARFKKYLGPVVMSLEVPRLTPPESFGHAGISYEAFKAAKSQVTANDLLARELARPLEPAPTSRSPAALADALMTQISQFRHQLPAKYELTKDTALNVPGFTTDATVQLRSETLDQFAMDAGLTTDDLDAALVELRQRGVLATTRDGRTNQMYTVCGESLRLTVFNLACNG